MKLQTHDLPALQAFYGEVLELPVATVSPTTVAVRAGTTRIEFAEVNDGTRPFYHFAITIPDNKLTAAREWLSGRVDLLRADGRPDGDDDFHFAAWNADSIYFHDPAGNIVEFITRHTLDNAAPGSFSTDDLLCVSEIGIVVPDRPAAAAALSQEAGLQRYLGSEMFIGDENGMFVLVNPGYAWYPEAQKRAHVFPTEVDFHGKECLLLTPPGLPYVFQAILQEGIDFDPRQVLPSYQRRNTALAKKKLPPPREITDQQVQEVFERHGFTTVSQKIISIDAYEMFRPLLTMVHWAQWWGEHLALRGQTTDLFTPQPAPCVIPCHAASSGQRVGMVPTMSLDCVLNMLKAWMDALRAYGVDPGLRSERINDEEFTHVQNELLDSIAPCLLELMSLALPPKPLDDRPPIEGDA